MLWEQNQNSTQQIKYKMQNSTSYILNCSTARKENVMGRKIRFEKMFNETECSELIFCGPSNKDGTYAMCVGCPECGEDIQVVLSAEEIEELHGATRS